MTGKNMVKWAIRRYQPSIYGTIGDDGAVPLAPVGKEQVFDEWRDVVVAAIPSSARTISRWAFCLPIPSS